ncbi:hypothetical protein BU15DRAFT_65507 [Melanogaster broomeanus]|nr:hypothetical protein BU15DRAFT_65507 [Melanogaster broomeanus]
MARSENSKPQSTTATKASSFSILCTLVIRSLASTQRTTNAHLSCLTSKPSFPRSRGSATGNDFYCAIPGDHRYQYHFRNYLKVLYELDEENSSSGKAHLTRLEAPGGTPDVFGKGYVIHPRDVHKYGQQCNLYKSKGISVGINLACLHNLSGVTACYSGLGDDYCHSDPYGPTGHTIQLVWQKTKRYNLYLLEFRAGVTRASRVPIPWQTHGARQTVGSMTLRMKVVHKSGLRTADQCVVHCTSDPLSDPSSFKSPGFCGAEVTWTQNVQVALVQTMTSYLQSPQY